MIPSSFILSERHCKGVEAFFLLAHVTLVDPAVEGILCSSTSPRGTIQRHNRNIFGKKQQGGGSWCLLIFLGCLCASLCHAQAAWQRGCCTARNEGGEGEETWGWFGVCFPSGRAGAWRQGSGACPHRELRWCHLVTLTWKEPCHCVHFPLWRQPIRFPSWENRQSFTSAGTALCVFLRPEGGARLSAAFPCPHSQLQPAAPFAQVALAVLQPCSPDVSF